MSTSFPRYFTLQLNLFPDISHDNCIFFQIFHMTITSMFLIFYMTVTSIFLTFQIRITFIYLIFHITIIWYRSHLYVKRTCWKAPVYVPRNRSIKVWKDYLGFQHEFSWFRFTTKITKMINPILFSWRKKKVF